MRLLLTNNCVPAPTVDRIMMPRGLVAGLVLLATGFALALNASMRRKSTEKKYQPIGGVAAALKSPQMHFEAKSYQNSGGGKPQDVTYCVIDERLVSK
jgi:hypothetical protein